MALIIWYIICSDDPIVLFTACVIMCETIVLRVCACWGGLFPYTPQGMRAFASFINFVVMMYQIVTREQQREWGLLKKKNHLIPDRSAALSDGHLSMDAEPEAWAEQRARESGFIGKAITLAIALTRGSAQVELDVETVIPIHSHEIPMEVPDLMGSFNMRNTNFVAHVDGCQYTADVSGQIDEMREDEGEETNEKLGTESMYKRNNITMLPIIQAELGSTSVVSAIMLFFNFTA